MPTKKYTHIIQRYRILLKQNKMENVKEDAYICPSFSSYSSDRLAEVAGKVAAENEDGNDDEFEFALVHQDKDFLPEELFFYEGQIGQVFPVFCRDLLLDDEAELCTSRGKEGCESSGEVEGVKVPLSKLLMENNDRCGEINDRDPLSCSSSEADELESIPAGTYCVWRPKVAETPSTPSQCKKSNSTGSASKRWKLPEFLRRSNSEGKDSFVFLTPKHRERKTDEKIEIPKKSKGKKTVGGAPCSPSAHESLYILNRATKEGNRKKSYLPYRQDLVGFFSNVNGLGKNLPRF